MATAAAAPGRRLRRDPAFRRRLRGTAVRGSDRPEHPRPVPHVRGGTSREGAGDLRLLQPLGRISSARRGYSVPTRTFRPDGFRAVESYGELMGGITATSTAWKACSCASAHAFPSRPMRACWRLGFPIATRRAFVPARYARKVGCIKIWGTSNNKRMTWWKDDVRNKLRGWQPLDSADPFAGQLAGKVSGDRSRGALHGRWLLQSMDYSRECARAGAPVRLRTVERRLYIGNRRVLAVRAGTVRRPGIQPHAAQKEGQAVLAKGSLRPLVDAR